MIFQGKNYDLVVGKPRPQFKTARFVFEGWTDEEQRNKYMGSISDFEIENNAGRVLPRTPAGRAIIKLVCWEAEDAVRDEDIYPAIGTICDVTFRHELASAEEIRNHFAAHGIALTPVEPFIKAEKTMTWLRFWAWKLFGKGFPGKERFPGVIA